MSEEKRRRLATHPIKDGIVKAIRSIGNVYTASVDAVSAAVRSALAGSHRAGTPVMPALTLVAAGAIRGALEAEADVTQASRGILVGMIHGTRESGEASLNTITLAARTIVHQTAMTESDVGGATTGVIRGAVQTAQDLGGDADRAAAAAARGASEGAEEVGFASSEQVRVALAGPFEGVSLPLLPPVQRQDHA